MRVVSLLPSATEVLFAIGAGDRVVGVTHECDHPAQAAALPVVTRDLLSPDALTAAEIDSAVTAGIRDDHTIYALDAAALRDLAPDVVVAQRLCDVCAVPVEMVTDAICAVSATARVVAADPHRLDDLLPAILAIGRAVDASPGADVLVDRLAARIAAVDRAVAGRGRPAVAVLEWPDPPWLPGHWVPDMVVRAGGSNVVGTPGRPSTRATFDDLATVDADVVVAAFCGFDLPATIDRISEIATRPQWRALTAGARLLAIDGSAYVSRPGPRLVDGIEILAHALHGVGGAPDPCAVAEWRDGSWEPLAA